MLERVAFVSIFKQGYGGGEGRAAHELARRFADTYDTALIVPGDTAGLVFDGTRLKVLQLRKVGKGNACVPLLSQENIRLLFGFLDQYQPDIVHAHDPALTGLLAQIWTKMRAKPFVHTSHILPGRMMDFGAKEVANIPEGFLADAFTHDYMNSFYRNCDAIIALNQPMVERFRQFGYMGRMFVIPNGRNLEQYSHCRNADLGAKEIHLTYIGFISRRKNQAFLIEALGHLPARYRLQIVGVPLNPEHLDQLKLAVHQAGLDDRVDFPGEISHKEIPSLLERTHVLVSASMMEVQSLVVIEGLASGTPVVGLSNETVDELVDDSVGRRLPKEATPEAFARSVERVCELPQAEYDRLCEAARRRVQNLDWSVVASRTSDAYEKILKDAASFQPDQNRLSKIIDLVPSHPVRNFLHRWAADTGEGGGGVRSVPIRTWVFTSLSVALSMAVQLDRSRRAVLLRRKHKGSTGKLTMPEGGGKGENQ
jgi:glycosyltransferase involved in cell wall biosynthesis